MTFRSRCSFAQLLANSYAFGIERHTPLSVDSVVQVHKHSVQGP